MIASHLLECKHTLSSTLNTQDGSGWTPLMISASLKDGDDLVNLLLQKGADVNLKSKIFSLCLLRPQI